ASWCAAPAQDRTQASQQFAWFKRFREVIIRAHFKPDDPIYWITAGRKHQDRSVGLGADLPADFQAVSVRQHQIKNDDMNLLPFMKHKPSRSVLRVDNVETRLAEVLAEHPSKTGIVFDQEHAFAHEAVSYLPSTTMPVPPRAV